MALIDAATIGLLGGTFDPPHLAHLALARCAQKQLGLARVDWIPAGQPWQKAGSVLAERTYRRAMVELLITGEARFRLDPVELDRGGPSYTIDTLRAKAGDGPLCLIIGQDQYAKLHTWHDWPELLTLVTLAVAARDGQAVQTPPELAHIPHRRVDIALPALDISSTEVRARAARGEDIGPMVGPAVAGYISQHRLYRE